MLIRPPVFPMSLELYDTSATVALSQTPGTVLKLPLVATAYGDLSYDTVTGEITLPLNGTYSFQSTFNPEEATSSTMWFYASINLGSGWVEAPLSGRRVRMRGQGADRQVYMGAEAHFPPCKIRFHLWTEDPTNLITQSVPSTTGVVVPAIRILISGK